MTRLDLRQYLDTRLLLTMLCVVTLWACSTEHHRVEKKQAAEVEALNDSGTNLRNRSDFTNALLIHEKALRRATELHDSIGMIIAANNLGTDMRRIGNLQEAVGYHLSALDLAENIQPDTSDIAENGRLKALNGLGNVQLSIGKLAEAEITFRRALKANEEMKSNLGMAINYANIGSIKQQEGELDSAMVYYRLSMECNQREKSAIGIGLCHTHFGEVAEMRKDYATAQKEYKKAYDVLVPTEDIWHTVEPLIAVGRMMLKQGNTEDAIKVLKVAKDMADETKSLELRSKVFDLLSLAAEKQNNQGQALAYLKLHEALRDSMLSHNKMVEMENSRINYERRKNRRALDSIQQQYNHERTRKRMYLVFSILFAILSAITLTILLAWRRTERQKTQLIEENLSIVEKNIAIQKTLYANISHEFRTPLTVINGLTEQLEGNTLTAEGRTTALANITRQTEMMLSFVDELLNVAKSMAASAVVPWKQKQKTDAEALQDRKATMQKKASNKNDDKICPTVLVAEDNDDIRNYIYSLLSADYNMVLASNGKEALELLSMTMPDLIITDVMMPLINGFELLKEVRTNEDTRHLPVIVITARAEEEDKMRGLQLGADAYLQKPFKSAELLLRVEKLIEQRRNIMEAIFSTFADKKMREYYNDGNMSTRDVAFLKDCHRQAVDLLIHQELLPEALADRLHMSYSQLNRHLKSTTGMTVNGYIENVKVTKACHLLSTTNLSIGEIATSCGFQDNSYFTRIFKRAKGMTPSQYRQQNPTS